MIKISVPDEKVSLSISTTVAPCLFCPYMTREESIAVCSKSGLKIARDVIDACEKEGWRNESRDG